MSAAPGPVMMAWVWISVLTLARLNTAQVPQEPHRAAGRALAGLEALLSDSEPPVETRSRGTFFPVPVWKFVKGTNTWCGFNVKVTLLVPVLCVKSII